MKRLVQILKEYFKQVLGYETEDSRLNDSYKVHNTQRKQDNDL